MKETLRYLRERHSLSQSQVATQLGISRQTYIKFESGESEPSLAQLRILADLFQVDLVALVEDRYSVGGRFYQDLEIPPASHVSKSPRSYKDIYAMPAMEPCVVSSPSPVYEGVFDGTCVRPLGEDFPARINQKVTITLQDEYLVDKATLVDELYGMLHHLADPSKWPLEERAWELHCMEKYGPAKNEADSQEEEE